MSANQSVQAAHDALLSSMPSGVSHEGCPLCSGAGVPEKALEVEVANDDKVFTEAQHVALLTSAVERETASLAEVKTELEATNATLVAEKAALEAAQTDLQTQIDVLESEKAAEAARAAAAEQALEDHKAEIAEKAAIEERKATRLAAVKAADATLDDEYLNETRIQRWAEMSDEAFTSLVEDLEAAAKKKPAFLEKKDGDDAETVKEKARETAAFTGGDAPSATGSTFAALLRATGKLPATTQS